MTCSKTLHSCRWSVTGRCGKFEKFKCQPVSTPRMNRASEKDSPTLSEQLAPTAEVHGDCDTEAARGASVAGSLVWWRRWWPAALTPGQRVTFRQPDSVSQGREGSSIYHRPSLPCWLPLQPDTGGESQGGVCLIPLDGKPRCVHFISRLVLCSSRASRSNERCLWLIWKQTFLFRWRRE